MSASDMLSDDQMMLRDAVQQLASGFLAGASRADRELKPPVENMKTLSDQGFTGTFVPEAYGGLGLGVLENTLIIEQVARSCANTAILMSMTDGATPRAILHLGSEEQKRRYLPRFVAGNLYAAWSMSEADAGSDLAGMKAKAVRDGDGYRISGSKMWCSCAQVADLFLVLVRMSDAKGLGGVGGVLVERGTPGFEIGEHLDLIGLRGTGMAPLFFDDCYIPADHVLFGAGGMRDLLNVFNADRISGNPTVCLGVAASALNGAAEYVASRRQFGQAIGDFQGLRWKLADMAIELEGARALVYRAARALDAGQIDPIDASITKTFANEAAIRITDAAMQLAGGYGLSAEYPFERHFRDVRGMAIGYGTTEIHRNNIGRAIVEGSYRA
ncbi:acyl-CoA dehydrogenase family protein [Sphingomonas profundi]|uniref:acyl-CoA dehydrogenase family protein n=1 Tax=Alterirhizorhabdus profundi TaxID=2681549 RepID=UPI0012E80492|nr:acyl-CoA dehydrogenase family protein [Sphingomonas profundi]